MSETSVIGSITRQTLALEFLEEAINKLVGELAPVLYRQEIRLAEGEDGPIPPRQGLSPVVEMIHGNNDIIANLTARVRSVTSDLTINEGVEKDSDVIKEATDV